MTTSFWQRIRRTPYQALASVLMIYITLFVVAGFLLLAGFSSAILSHFESKPQLTIFFNDEKDKASIDKLLEKLKSTGKIAGTNYISKDQALAIYREQNKNDPLLLEMVTADILPASLEISATSPKYLSELAEIAKKEQGINEVVFQKDVVDILVSWISSIRKVGIVFIAILLLSTIFILLTSIGIKIALRKEEIEILKLVGATSWYIKRPFIGEGILYGLIGASMASLTITMLLLYSTQIISSFLYGITELILYRSTIATVFIWPPNIILIGILWCTLMLMGIFIGLFGSFLSVSRYMKY